MIFDSWVTSDGTVAMIGEAPMASVAFAESLATTTLVSCCQTAE